MQAAMVTVTVAVITSTVSAQTTLNICGPSGGIGIGIGVDPTAQPGGASHAHGASQSAPAAFLLSEIFVMKCDDIDGTRAAASATAAA